MSIRRARRDYCDLAESLTYWLADHSPLGCRQCADVARGCEAYSLRPDLAVSVQHASARRAPNWLPTPATPAGYRAGRESIEGEVYMSKGSR